jgi:hypothetical protein
MPPAAESWALRRDDPPTRPAEEQIAVIASDFQERKSEAVAQGRAVAEIQLDYDCPTGDNGCALRE